MCNERKKNEHGSNFGRIFLCQNKLGNTETLFTSTVSLFNQPSQEQFVFVHEAILESILCGINEVDSAGIRKEIENLAAVQDSGMTGFEEKFKVGDTLR